MPLSAAESPRGVLGRARPFAKRPPGSNSYGKVVLKSTLQKKRQRQGQDRKLGNQLPPIFIEHLRKLGLRRLSAGLSSTNGFS